jgi:TolB protein
VIARKAMHSRQFFVAIFALILLCVAQIARTQETHPQKLAFERNDAVWVANLDGSGTKKIVAGIFPARSPNGARIAFNTVEKNGDTYVRHIAIAEIENGKTTVFKDVPSENSYYPTWSPDGTQILFTLYDGHNWHIGLINADGSGFRFVKKAKADETTLYSPCWARDGQSFFCQDMTKLYRIGLDGAVQAQWEIPRIVQHGDMSGDGRIAVSPDGRRLLLGIDMDEQHNRKDWDSPPPALWSFDLDTQKSTRLTPKTLFAWDGCWADDHTVIFLSQDRGEKTASIYRMSASGNGKDRKLLIKNARMPSVSR